MIVRILSEGQYDVADAALDRLNELDAAVETAVADGDDVVYLEGADHDHLLERIFTADRVITW